MEKEYVVTRIVRRTKMKEEQADKAIDTVIGAVNCYLHGRPPPAGCPFLPGALISKMKVDAGISQEQAGVALTIIVGAVTHLAHANGIRSVLEFHDEEL